MKRKKVRVLEQILPGGDPQIREEKNEKKAMFLFSRLTILPMFI